MFMPCLVPALLVAAPPAPQSPAEAGALALEALRRLQPGLGLDAGTGFHVRAVQPDPVLSGTDVRVEQFHRGVRVMGGEAIVHLKRNGAVRDITNALKAGLTVDPRPSLTPSEALALAKADLAPRGPFARQPTIELLVVRMKFRPDAPAPREVLAYRAHFELENGTAETAHMDYLVDAHTGAILKKWNSLRTTAAVGTGQTQYSGQVSLNTDRTDAGFELRDLTRGAAGNTVWNLDHATDPGKAQVYAAPGNTWGDGLNYAGGATTGANGQTAAADAAFGLQSTWDYYRNVHGRDGIDGQGRETNLRMHYDTGYDNAFWSDSCFCMTFGDGDRFKSLDSLDVIGHEVSHGVCSATANLEYFGESGGLNEANSDIHGTMVEFYARGGHGPEIGNWGGNWLIGEQLETPAHLTPLRYMYKPSKDGRSPDAWSEDLGVLDVHHSSGPMNRCFFFLSIGASSDPASERASEYLPGGMGGLGNDKAARIWYRAMASYMTSGADYQEARQDSIRAAQDLYGAGGREEQAVWNAFHAINVGDAWPSGGKRSR